MRHVNNFSARAWKKPARGTSLDKIRANRAQRFGAGATPPRSDMHLLPARFTATTFFVVRPTSSPRALRLNEEAPPALLTNAPHRRRAAADVLTLMQS